MNHQGREKKNIEPPRKRGPTIEPPRKREPKMNQEGRENQK